MDCQDQFGEGLERTPVYLDAFAEPFYSSDAFVQNRVVAGATSSSSGSADPKEFELIGTKVLELSSR